MSVLSKLKSVYWSAMADRRIVDVRKTQLQAMRAAKDPEGRLLAESIRGVLENRFTRSPNDDSPLKILIVNLDFPPIGGPGIWRVLAFCKYLSLSGADVHVICSDRSTWHRRRDPSVLAQIPETVKVTRLRSMLLSYIDRTLDKFKTTARTGRSREIMAAISWRLEKYCPNEVLLWGLKAALRSMMLAVRWRPDCILTSGPQHISHLAGLAAATLCDAVWVMDYRDPWTGNPTQRQFVPGTIEEKFSIFLEPICARHADAIVTVSPSWKQWLAARFSSVKPATSFHLIRNGHDLAAEPTAALRPPRSDGRRVLHFNGTVQAGNNVLDPLFRALAALRAQHPGGDLPLLSFCGLPEQAAELARALEIDDLLHDFGPLSQAASISASAGADALMIFVRSGDTLQTGVIPGKTYEAMALGKPILALVPARNDVRELLHDYPAAVVSADDSQEAIHASLCTLMLAFKNNRPPACPVAARDLAAIRREYSREKQTGELRSLIDSIRANR